MKRIAAILTMAAVIAMTFTVSGCGSSASASSSDEDSLMGDEGLRYTLRWERQQRRMGIM